MPNAGIISGRELAESLLRQIRDTVENLRLSERFVPGLAVVLVGEDPASQVYVRTKAKQTEEVGMRSLAHRLPADVREEDLLTLIHGLNRDERVHGILVQLPLPPHINKDHVLASISPDKDVDGFHVINTGRLLSGVPGAIVPCTPAGCLRLIKSQQLDLSGMKAVIVGRSNIVGKPMAVLLLAEDCTVTIVHSKTRDLPAETRQADILIAAVGRPEMVRGDWIKPGAIVIDVGINRMAGPNSTTRLVGDVHFAEALEVARAVTPVPGGVGPMTVACLLRNALISACRLRGVSPPDI
jgi:methylenetetrahydrofolate dehydrogenase (NADP+)/methenyltetrahydrofolate cyclohydrolase